LLLGSFLSISEVGVVEVVGVESLEELLKEFGDEGDHRILRKGDFLTP
jgi:hypothetical protein